MSVNEINEWIHHFVETKTDYNCGTANCIYTKDKFGVFKLTKNEQLNCGHKTYNEKLYKFIISLINAYLNLASFRLIWLI
jgi:hypothetical protein